ncbi:MAG TPA: hypothetical protein VH590_06930 [Ktedonobacterales bacterium]
MAAGTFADALRQGAERLETSGLPWCVMAGAAATCYGVTRPITDIDILICSQDTARVLALFPDGQPQPNRHPGEYALDLGPLEIWWGTLYLKGGERVYAFAPDARLLQRVTRQQIAGVVVPIMPAEDVILFKAILQRGPEQHKHDLEDIQAMWERMGQRLDLAYMKERAVTCDALERVAPCLQRLGISL